MCSAKGHVRFTPKADMCGAKADVRFVPIAELAHSMTTSTRRRNVSEILRPMAFAVLRLMASSNFVGCSIGRSFGCLPCRIFCTSVVPCRTAAGPSAPGHQASNISKRARRGSGRQCSRRNIPPLRLPRRPAQSGVTSGAQVATSGVTSGAQVATSGVRSGAQVATSGVRSGTQQVSRQQKSSPAAPQHMTRL